ncbi:MAG: inorganic diphosphatase [Acidobacteriota bacterium]
MRCSTLPARSLLLTLLLLLASTAAVAEWIHPFDYPQAKKAPAEIMAVIEIPAGSFTKYEMDPDTGHILVDRVVRMPVTYPANYGSVSQTAAGDGDPLDVLVYTREPLHPGVLIKVRPVAILKSLDGGEQDDKIIAVPASKIDPTYDEIQDIDDLPDYDKKRMEAFFRVYKQLKSDKVIEIKGWANADEARKMVQVALDLYAQPNDD